MDCSANFRVQAHLMKTQFLTRSVFPIPVQLPVATPPELIPPNIPPPERCISLVPAGNARMNLTVLCTHMLHK